MVQSDYDKQIEIKKFYPYISDMSFCALKAKDME